MNPGSVKNELPESPKKQETGSSVNLLEVMDHRFIVGRKVIIKGPKTIPHERWVAIIENGIIGVSFYPDLSGYLSYYPTQSCFIYKVFM